MKAHLLEAPAPIDRAPLAWRDVAVPACGPGMLRVGVSTCGVCRTDLHIVEGDLELPALPLIPGHQVTGTVIETGRDVRGFAVGARVGVAWLHEACGSCAPCQRDRENLCGAATFTGLSVPGGYAESLTVPAAFAYRLPDGLDDLHAAPLLCAGIIGLRALNACKLETGQTVGLYGFGGSAHVTIQVAVHRGLTPVVFTRSAAHRRHARALGSCWEGDARDTPPAPLDGAVIFAPVGWIVPEALRATRPGGTVVSAGIHMTDLPAMPYRRLYGERTLTTVANATRGDGRELLRLAEAIPIQTTAVRYDFPDANRALRDLKEAAFDGAAVLVR